MVVLRGLAVSYEQGTPVGHPQGTTPNSCVGYSRKPVVVRIVGSLNPNAEDLSDGENGGEEGDGKAHRSPRFN